MVGGGVDLFLRVHPSVSTQVIYVAGSGYQAWSTRANSGSNDAPSALCWAHRGGGTVFQSLPEENYASIHSLVYSVSGVSDV